MSHPQDPQAVGISEVSSCFTPAQRGVGGENPVTGCSQLSPSPQPSTLPTLCTLHLGRQPAPSTPHGVRRALYTLYSVY